jgi:hypothetical protein
MDVFETENNNFMVEQMPDYHIAVTIKLFTWIRTNLKIQAGETKYSIRLTIFFIRLKQSKIAYIPAF